MPPVIALLAYLGVLRGHTSEVWTVAFSPDGYTLITGGKDGTMRLWSVKRPVAHDILTRDVNFWNWPVFSADGQWLAVGERKAGVTLWRVSDGTLAGSIADAERPLAFGTNAQALMTLGHNDKLQFWNLPLTNDPPMREIPLGTAEVRAHAFLPDRGLLVTGDRQGEICLWDVRSGVELGRWKAHPDRIVSIALSPDHTLLATASESDDDAKLWDLARHQLKLNFHGHTMSVYAVAFSPDGRTVATSSIDDTCGLWDVRTGQRFAVLGGHKGGAYSVAFSPDGKTLAVGCNDGQLKLWNLATQRDMMTLAAEPHAIFSAGFSPDGRTLATVSFNHHNEDCSLQLWRTPGATGIEADSP